MIPVRKLLLPGPLEIFPGVGDPLHFHPQLFCCFKEGLEAHEQRGGPASLEDDLEGVDEEGRLGEDVAVDVIVGHRRNDRALGSGAQVVQLSPREVPQALLHPSLAMTRNKVDLQALFHSFEEKVSGIDLACGVFGLGGLGRLQRRAPAAKQQSSDMKRHREHESTTRTQTGALHDSHLGDGAVVLVEGENEVSERSSAGMIDLNLQKDYCRCPRPDARGMEEIEELAEYFGFALKKDDPSIYTGTVVFNVTVPQLDNRAVPFTVRIDRRSSKAQVWLSLPPDGKHDLFVDMSLPDLLHVYSGKAGAGDVASLVLSGRIRVRWLKFAELARFANSFDYQTERWIQFYRWRASEGKDPKGLEKAAQMMRDYSLAEEGEGSADEIKPATSAVPSSAISPPSFTTARPAFQVLVEDVDALLRRCKEDELLSDAEIDAFHLLQHTIATEAARNNADDTLTGKSLVLFAEESRLAILPAPSLPLSVT